MVRARKERCTVIENKETGERFLLELQVFMDKGIPKGFGRITHRFPLNEKYFDLPYFK